ncbi:MAG: hypothetical protein II943_04485 [Victivallales bacterium]|nr:hypothetical protein [Victivallales bacterium]
MESCAECRAFATAALLAVPPRPSLETDARTLGACHGILAVRRRRRRMRFIYAAAACAAILLGITLLLRNSPDSTIPVGSPKIAQNTPQATQPDRSTALAIAASDASDAASNQPSLLEIYTEALSWDVDVSLSTKELDQMEFNLALLNAGL